MAHWSDKYVGQEYCIMTNDCGTFAVRVARDEFGKKVALPTHVPRSVREQQARILLEIGKDYGTPTDSPVEGDIVLMMTRNKFPHVGLYSLINGEPWVIHSLVATGVCAHRLRDLGNHNLAFHSYYSWLEQE